MKRQYRIKKYIIVLVLLMVFILLSGCRPDMSAGWGAESSAKGKTAEKGDGIKENGEASAETPADYHGLLRITEIALKNSASLIDDDGEFVVTRTVIINDEEEVEADDTFVFEFDNPYKKTSGDDRIRYRYTPPKTGVE